MSGGEMVRQLEQDYRVCFMIWVLEVYRDNLGQQGRDKIYRRVHFF